MVILTNAALIDGVLTIVMPKAYKQVKPGSGSDQALIRYTPIKSLTTFPLAVNSALFDVFRDCIIVDNSSSYQTRLLRSL